MDEVQVPREERRPAGSVARTVSGSLVWWSDVAVAIVLVAVFWVPSLLSASQAGLITLGACLAGVSAAAVIVRWRLPSAAPVIALTATAAGWMLQVSADPMLAVAWCLYPLALQGRGRSRIIGGAAVVVMVLVSLTHGSSTPAVDQRIILSAVVIGAVWLLGQAEARRLEAVRESADRRAAYERAMQETSMAREVHDVVGHALSVISAEADVSRSLTDLGEAELREALADIEQRARGALEEVQQLVRSLRQGEVGPGRETPLPQLVVAARVSGLDVQSRMDIAGLSDELNSIVSRVVQEALSNTVRHAEATRCEIAIWQEDEAVTVRVDDDGNGLPSRYSPGMGLTGMRERVGAAGGSMTVTNRLEGGTRLLVSLPSVGRI
ncbi:MAG: sensor histidine kinase [Microbacterium sp.]